MNGCCFVTVVDSLEPLNWGLQIERIAVPMVLFCSPDMVDALRDCRIPPNVIVVATDVPPTLSLQEKLVMLEGACRAGHHDAQAYYWLDTRLIYQNLSFEFLYSGLLARAVARFAPQPAYFPMPGYDASAFFGGTPAAIDALARTPGGAIESIFTSAFGSGRASDLNLSLAAIVDDPVLHVIGDSHVLNCFTPTGAIGCRPNVLVRTSDVSNRRLPYVYQFTHYLGSRTMHFAGRRGTLQTIAGECGVKAGDAVVWVFGEIDARCHILRQHAERGRALDDVIGTLVSNYIDGILDVQRAHDGVCSIVAAPIPPLDNLGYVSDDFPVYGSIDERIDATRRLRAALSTLCDRHGLLCLDVSAHYESARGDLRWELSDHFCHVATGCQAPAIDALYQLLASDAEAVPTRDVSSGTCA